MKKIEKFVSRDGAEFRTEEDARNREQLLDEIDSIESFLPKKPNTTDFANGHGYIQHKEINILKARSMLIDLAKSYVFTQISDYDLRSYAFGRYLDDNNSLLYVLYIRIVSCIDDSTWREYGQPYFANHPDEAKQKRLN